MAFVKFRSTPIFSENEEAPRIHNVIRNVEDGALSRTFTHFHACCFDHALSRILFFKSASHNMDTKKRHPGSVWGRVMATLAKTSATLYRCGVES